MSAFTEEVLLDKLNRMNNSQQSIQTLSHWVQYHRKRHVQSVAIWDKEIYKAPNEKKLTFLYLANDIMQGSRKKGGEFIREFSKVIKPTVIHVWKESNDPQTQKAIKRLIDVWEERKVISQTILNEISAELGIEKSVKRNLGADSPMGKISVTKDNLLVTTLSKVDESETLVNSMNEKVVKIRPELLTGAAFNTTTDQSEIQKLLAEFQRSRLLLQQFQSKLEEDLNARNNFIGTLTEAIETQETQINRSTALLKECQSSLITAEQMKTILESRFGALPSVPSQSFSPTASPYSPNDSPVEDGDSKRQKTTHPVSTTTTASTTQPFTSQPSIAPNMVAYPHWQGIFAGFAPLDVNNPNLPTQPTYRPS